MADSLAKRPGSFMRAQTQQVRDHSAAMARLTDQYLAALKRAEAQYFDGVRRITDAITAEQHHETEPAAVDGRIVTEPPAAAEAPAKASPAT